MSGTIAAYRRVIGNGRLTRALGAHLAAETADWTYLVALLIIVYAATDSPLVLGVVGAARIVPYAVLSLPGGALADRLPRRTILVAGASARALLMIGLLLVTLAEGPLLVIVVGALVAASVSALAGPAVGAIVPALVRDESELGAANATWDGVENVAFVVGPFLGGVIIAAFGTSAVFAVTAVIFAISTAVYRSLPSEGRATAAPAETTPDDRSASATEPSTVRDRAKTSAVRARLTGLIVIESVLSFVAGALGVLTVVVAVDVLGLGEAATGTLNAAIGVGGFVGVAAAGVLALRHRMTVPLSAATAALCLSLVALALGHSLTVASIAFAFGAAGVIVVDVVLLTLLQRSIPDDLLGRSIGLLLTVWAIAYALGSFAGPVLAARVGLGGFLGGAAVALVAAVLIGAALLRPAMRAAPLAAEVEHVARLPLFGGLPPARVEQALRRLRPRAVVAGEDVIRQGDPADHFYVVVAGRFRVTQSAAMEGPPGGPMPVRDEGPRRLLRELGPDDVFGEIGLLQRVPRTATVTALTDGRLLMLEGREFLELVGAAPGLGSRLADLHRGATGR